MGQRNPIIIVGGGIIGISLAYHLRDTDRSVILLEKNELLGGGTTQESIAMLGINYPSPLSMRRYSRDHYYSLIDEGTIEFEQTGGLLVEETAAGIETLRETATDLAELGHESTLLTPDEVGEFGVHIPEGSRALHLPSKGYLDPGEIISYWSTAAREGNVEIRTETPVTEITVEHGSVTGVVTPEQSITTSTVVNAAGPWAPQINEMVDLSLPLRHNYGPILVLEAGQEFSVPFTSFPSKHYIRQEGQAQVFAGQRGLPYSEATRQNPDHARSVPESFYLEIQELLETAIPELADAPVTNEWYGMRTITPDNLPLVGETAVDGFYAACGLSGKGITIGPAVGHLLAQRLDSGETTPVLAELAPDRFA